MDDTLFTTFVRVLAEHLRDCKPQELANSAWVFARKRHVGELLFMALVSASTGHSLCEPSSYLTQCSCKAWWPM